MKARNRPTPASTPFEIACPIKRGICGTRLSLASLQSGARPSVPVAPPIDTGRRLVAAPGQSAPLYSSVLYPSSGPMMVTAITERGGASPRLCVRPSLLFFNWRAGSVARPWNCVTSS